MTPQIQAIWHPSIKMFTLSFRLTDLPGMIWRVSPDNFTKMVNLAKQTQDFHLEFVDKNGNDCEINYPDNTLFKEIVEYLIKMNQCVSESMYF